jgi:hypothetical protein
MMLRKVDDATRDARIAEAKSRIDAAATDGPPYEVAVDFDIHAELRAWVQGKGVACGVWHDLVDGERETRLVISPLKAYVPEVEESV